MSRRGDGVGGGGYINVGKNMRIVGAKFKKTSSFFRHCMEERRANEVKRRNGGKKIYGKCGNGVEVHKVEVVWVVGGWWLTGNDGGGGGGGGGGGKGGNERRVEEK
ncbi:hypothetical protein M0804_001397 [Polistes exclamans]|nr:hypothetical protein M0804_001397 [Polistes exclamans]